MSLSGPFIRLTEGADVPPCFFTAVLLSLRWICRPGLHQNRAETRPQISPKTGTSPVVEYVFAMSATFSLFSFPLPPF